MRVRLVLVCLIIFSFLAMSSTAMEILDVSPNDGATEVSTSPNLSVTIANMTTPYDWMILSEGEIVEKQTGITQKDKTLTAELEDLEHNKTYQWTLILNQTYIYNYEFTTKESTSGEGSFSDKINLFPSTPSSGDSFAIMLDEKMNTGGYIYVNGELVPVAIMNGFGIISLDKNLFGQAMLWLYGSEDGTSYTKNFEIECGVQGSLQFRAPEFVHINDEAKINVSVGGMPIENVEVTITNPDGEESVIVTDKNGGVQHVMDKVGNWFLRTSFANQNAVKEVVVEKGELNVYMEDDEFEVGEQIEIEVPEPGAKIEITKDGQNVLSGSFVNKKYTFSLENTGVYTAKIWTANKEEQLSFKIFKEAQVNILTLDNQPVSAVETGNKYMVKVVDGKNVPITTFNAVLTDGQPILLNGGIGFWTPDEPGTMHLFLNEIDGYDTKGTSIQVLGGTINTSGEGLELNWAGIILLIIIFIVILLYFFRDKLPKNIKGIFDKFLKPKREVPI